MSTGSTSWERTLDVAIEVALPVSFSRLGFAARSRFLRWPRFQPGACEGQVAVVTGATSGIGAALARELAVLGARVHLVGRDPEKLDRAVAELRPIAGSDRLVPHAADLARLDDVRTLATDLLASEDRIDVLAHVAGALVHDRVDTVDGLELTAQVHVVAPFLLTSRLLPLLRAGSGRVLTMSSGGMLARRLDVDQLLDPAAPFDGTLAYAHAKRAQVELNRFAATKHAHLGVAFHSLHPGWVATPGLDAGLPGFARWMRPFLRTPEQGADTAVWLATDPDLAVPGGAFWHDRRPRPTSILPWTTAPAGETERLWSAVAELAGVDRPSNQPHVSASHQS